MLKLPVYSDTYGYHQINVWTLVDGGEFRRTAHWLLPHLLINFDSISESLGRVVAPEHDRKHHEWSSPTAYFYMGRPMSLYKFLRQHALQREIMVLTTPTMSGRAREFSISELRFRNNVSTAVKALTARSFLEEIEVFMNPERRFGDAGEGIEVTGGFQTAAPREDHDTQVEQWLPQATVGDAHAQYALGHLYEYGERAAQDPHAAAHWYAKAAAQGYTPAQARLGVIYGAGRGVPQNYVLAHFWTSLVAASGIDSAERLRDMYAARMTPAQLAAAGKLFDDWRPTEAGGRARRRQAGQPLPPDGGTGTAAETTGG